MTGYVLKLSYDQDRVSYVDRLRDGNEEGLSPRDHASSPSLMTESGLRAPGPLHVLESDAVEELCTLSLTSGTKSLPSIPGGRRARSRLGGEREIG